MDHKPRSPIHVTASAGSQPNQARRTVKLAKNPSPTTSPKLIDELAISNLSTRQTHDKRLEAAKMVCNLCIFGENPEFPID